MNCFIRKLLLPITAIVILSACATIGPPQPPSLELAKPPLDLRATRKGNKVLLTWTVPTHTTDRQTIRTPGSARICRGTAPLLTECGTPVGEAPQNPDDSSKPANRKWTASFGDALPTELQRDNPSGFITYAVEIPNSSGRAAALSNQVRVPLAPTLPPPQDFVAQVTGQGVTLSWTAAQPTIQPSTRYVFRIYRHGQGARQLLVGELPLTGETNYTLSDPEIEWEQTYDYHAEAVTIFEPPNQPEMRIEGDDTPEIRVVTHDIFPPTVPSGLQAVFSGPGQQPSIDLIWAPVPDMDLVGYNIYRREAGKAAEKFNADIVKTPAYRDLAVSSGENYFYSVTAVDVRGNESAHSEEASERVP
jgi:hypothetical protein